MLVCVGGRERCVCEGRQTCKAMGVAITPGQTELTRILCAAWSTASALLRAAAPDSASHRCFSLSSTQAVLDLRP